MPREPVASNASDTNTYCSNCSDVLAFARELDRVVKSHELIVRVIGRSAGSRKVTAENISLIYSEIIWKSIRGSRFLPLE